MVLRFVPIVTACCLAIAAGCRSTAKEPEPGASPSDDTAKAEGEAAGSARAAAKSGEPSAEPAARTPSSTAAEAFQPTRTRPRKVHAKPVASVTPSPDDPLKGQFTLEQATKGIEGDGTLTAVIKTSLGALSCTLFEDKAPITVANFVGLARGLRPWKNPEGKWVEKPAYDGTVFHRIIKGFMIQGGDPTGTGGGQPGYVIPDEVWEDAHHDERGLLCMANRGPNTNGAQFFILDAAAPHLDSGYTIFGKCGPDDVIEKLASAPVNGDRAADPPKIDSVRASRKK